MQSNWQSQKPVRIVKRARVKDMRLWIIDTNVVVSGLISRAPDSPTAMILEGMLSGQLVFVLSPALLVEYRAVLLRPNITERHGLTEPEVDQILIELAANAKWSEPEHDDVHFAPDNGDAHLWSLLKTHPEASLITGDRLLIQNPRPGSKIISPSDYVNPKRSIQQLNQPSQIYRTTG